ncbi:MAG TPA: heavy metal-binding domain-containing protein [Ktedonobacterales bacterium]
MQQQPPQNPPPGGQTPGYPPQGAPQQGMPQQQLPPQAIQRLQAMRGGPGQAGLFTSDLSVNEFLLVKSAGFEPLGLVVGSSIYHMGFQFNSIKQNQEVTILSQAMYHARELAMTRMEQEAMALGADGVVGVRLDINMRQWGAALAEFMAIGTAVRSTDGKNHRTVQNMPFTSDLSGQDFYTLVQSGYSPVGLVMGTCVYHIAYQSFSQWFKNIGQNVEMPNYTQGLYEARELAMARMQAEAMNLRAQGIVGAQIQERSHGWGSHILEYFAIGTAVIQTRSEHTIQQPQFTLSLNDPAAPLTIPTTVPTMATTAG